MIKATHRTFADSAMDAAGPPVASSVVDHKLRIIEVKADMIRTPVCSLLGIDLPVMCASFGPWDNTAVVAAVAEAGGIGAVGTSLRPVDELREQWRHLGKVTSGRYLINHTMRPLDEKAFAASLESEARGISFHMGVPADLIAATHDAGKLWIQQVIDVEEAADAISLGADVVIAQGGEAGGHGGWTATMVIVPMVVDIAGDVPVVAAGGIADGRGLAAALALGAQGVNVGTRFLATPEMAVTDSWKQRILAAVPTDAVKVLNTDEILPPFSRPVTRAEPRSLLTPLVGQLATAPESVNAAELLPVIIEEVLRGGGDEYLPFAGQSVGLIDEIVPVAEIVERMVREATTALRAAAAAVT